MDFSRQIWYNERIYRKGGLAVNCAIISKIHFTHYRPDCYALTDRYLIECSDMVFIPSPPGSCQDAERYACSLRKRVRRLTIDLRP